jgi:hypothetical protein
MVVGLVNCACFAQYANLNTLKADARVLIVELSFPLIIKGAQRLDGALKCSMAFVALGQSDSSSAKPEQTIYLHKELSDNPSCKFT